MIKQFTYPYGDSYKLLVGVPKKALIAELKAIEEEMDFNLASLELLDKKQRKLQDKQKALKKAISDFYGINKEDLNNEN